MRKLIIFLTIFTLVFMFTPNVFAAPAFGNVGPTTEFGYDISIVDELVAEGATDDEFETIITFTDPTTEDRIITIPDSAQTIGTATAIEDGLILEADLNADEEPTNNDICTFDETGANFSWQTPGELELVTTSGTPADSQVTVWTADGIIEGAASLTYDGSNLQLTGDIGSTGTKITKGWFTDLEVANDITGSITGNAETVTTADNESEAEENEVPFVAGAAGPGDAALESDSGFTYNPSTGTLTAAAFAGDVTGDLTGNADTVTFADNDAESEENEILFAGNAAASGDCVVEADSDYTYNPSTGTVTATEFVGGGAGLTDVTATANYTLHCMDMDAADIDYVHLVIVGDGTSQDISTEITNPDYGRIITVTSTDGSAGVVTITGTLADGTTGQTDAITIISNDTAVGVKPFVYVSNINCAAEFISPEEVTIGIGDVIGLPNAVSAEADVYMKTVDGVEEYGEISGNVDTTYNTLDCGTIAQNEDLTVLYHP